MHIFISAKGKEMLIRCPNCKVCYRISEELVPEKGRRFRCAKCGNVWTVMPADLFEETPENEAEIYVPEEHKAEAVAAEMEKSAPYDAGMSDELSAAEMPEAEKEVETPKKTEEEKAVPEEKDEINAEDLAVQSNMQEIFSRLDKQQELLEKEEKNIPPLKRAWSDCKKALGLNSLFNRCLFSFIILMIGTLALFSFRYDIVRKFPWAERFYTAMGTDSVIVGEGLEFQNISRHEYEEDYIKKLQIKGFLVNKTEKEIAVPTIHVEVLSKEAAKLQEMNVRPPVEKILPGKRIAFNVIITQPSPLSKHILLTFTKNKAG